MQKHIPVLLNETIQILKVEEGDTVVDCTLGDGGHAQEIAKKIGEKGLLIGIDLDERNVDAFNELNLANAKGVKGNFKDIAGIINKFGLRRVTKIVADLGFSSRQLDTISGLSFQEDSALDMRLSSEDALTAEEIVNQYPVAKLTEIFKNYGEETKARLIAEEIIKRRKKRRIRSSKDLAEIVQACYGGKIRVRGMNVSTKVFMALRIAVNDELGNLEALLQSSLECLQPGGRIAIISFHSLEDRIVKNFFRRESKGCICEEEPQCQCSHQPQFKLLTKHPITASVEEIQNNPRSRSARARAAEKI